MEAEAIFLKSVTLISDTAIGGLNRNDKKIYVAFFLKLRQKRVLKLKKSVFALF